MLIQVPIVSFADNPLQSHRFGEKMSRQFFENFAFASRESFNLAGLILSHKRPIKKVGADHGI
jgi:hypothetical protein